MNTFIFLLSWMASFCILAFTTTFIVSSLVDWFRR